MTPRDIFIDIDGVCLRCAPALPAGIEPALHCFEFLQWAVEFHRPHWLTTRDAHGEHDGILRAFMLAMGCPTQPADVEALLRSVQPTAWSGSKVSAIDLTSDFAWIDDEPMGFEIEALRRRGLLDWLVVVDTNKNDDALLQAIDAIKQL